MGSAHQFVVHTPVRCVRQTFSAPGILETRSAPLNEDQRFSPDGLDGW